MFRLSGRVIDWADEISGREDLVKHASNEMDFGKYALILEDYEGNIGHKYPLDTKENLLLSMESFEKYASRVMPLHRRVAASFMEKACGKWDVQPTEKVAMYSDDSIQSRTVSYRQAMADYEPTRASMEVKDVINKIAALSEEDPVDDFPVDPDFISCAVYDLSMMMKEAGVAEPGDEILDSLVSIRSLEIPVASNDLYEIIKSACDLSNISIYKTKFYDKNRYPKAEVEKRASAEDLDHFIRENIWKLNGHMDESFIDKVSSADSPSESLASMPADICKMVATLINNDE